MKQKTFIIALIVLFYTNFGVAQVIEPNRQAAELLWSNYDQNPQNPSSVPDPIPLNISNANIDRENIPATYAALKNAMEKLKNNSGGIISFTNSAPATISFNDINEAIDLQVTPFTGPYKTIVIQGNNNITFDGSNQSSIFVIRRKVRLIIQNVTFQNCFLKREIIQNPSRFRISGGAIEASNASYLRVYNCTFKNNAIAEWNDTPGGGYDGVGENQNGAAIRLNNGTTCEVFKCTFQNNVAVTGGAIGATSINKLTIMDSSFDKNISTSYNTKNSTNRRIVEGAGAIRVDRTALPVEIYRTSFTENAANIKTSVIEVFIRPLRVNGAETGAYPGPNGNALIIDNCIFQNNKYYNFQGASDPDRSSFFAGVILFHGGSLTNNFQGATMKVSNTKFIDNDISESHIRGLLSYEVNNSIFANSNFLRLRDGNNNFRTGKAALMLRGEPKEIVIDRCTFYNNNPNIADQTNATASDIFFWGNTPSNATLSNSIFYRTNANTNFKQVIKPMTGSGNNQYIPGVVSSNLSEVSTTISNKTNPNIVANSIVDMCLGTNSLPNGVGGLNNCSGTPPPPSGVAIPGIIQVENFIAKNGEVRTENTPGGGQNLGFIKNNNYTEYDINVAETGRYKLDVFTSSNGVGGNIILSVDGVNLATLLVPVNNAWHTYTTPVTTNLDLVAGVQKIRLTYTGSTGFLFNFDRAELSLNAVVPVTFDCNDAPNGLKAISSTANSITFSFDNSSTDLRRFELRAFPQGVFVGNINFGAISYAAAPEGSSTITIGGLQGATSYDFVFRALCSNSSPGVSSLAPILKASTSGVLTNNRNKTGIEIIANKGFVEISNLTEFGGNENLTYTWYNLSGQVIKRDTLNTSKISTEGFSKGIYLLELNKGIKRKVFKALIQ